MFYIEYNKAIRIIYSTLSYKARNKLIPKLYKASRLIDYKLEPSIGALKPRKCI